ncbi:MAG: pro-sigmaK processing inhibitor BofA family protein [Bacilli bacterium]
MLKLIKKILFAVFLLYSFNLISVNFNIIIPINFITVLLVTLLDLPGMITLLISMITIFS